MAKTLQLGTFGWMYKPVEVESVVRDIEALRGVQASASSPYQDKIDHWNLVRNHLVSLYQNMVDGVINDLHHQAHLILRKHHLDTEEGVTALFLILSDDFEPEFASAMQKTGAKAYRYAEAAMGEKDWGDFKERSEEFGKLRAPDLTNAPKEIIERLRASVARGIAGKESPAQIARRLNEAVEQAKEMEGSRVAQTESTITQGTAIDSVLKAAGYTHKKWVSQRDDRVRKSHQECDAQGKIPIDKTFKNGLRFPGDPNGPLEEIIGCRCVLVPEGRNK